MGLIVIREEEADGGKWLLGRLRTYLRIIGVKNFTAVYYENERDFFMSTGGEVLLPVGHKLVKVPAHNIVCCEADRKHQHVCLADGSTITLRLTLAKLWDKLSKYDEFARVGVSYIINFHYVESMSADTLRLSGGRTLYVPRSSRLTVKQQYETFNKQKEATGGGKRAFRSRKSN